jgi:hypothetical protein
MACDTDHGSCLTLGVAQSIAFMQRILVKFDNDPRNRVVHQRAQCINVRCFESHRKTPLASLGSAPRDNHEIARVEIDWSLRSSTT